MLALAAALTSSRGIHFVDFLSVCRGRTDTLRFILAEFRRRPCVVEKCRYLREREGNLRQKKVRYFSYPSGKYLECLILGTAPSPQHTKREPREDDSSEKTKPAKRIPSHLLPVSDYVTSNRLNL